MTSSIFERFLTSPDIIDVFSDAAMIQAMLDFEEALARAQAAEGVIPVAAAQSISGVCKAELYDLGAIAAQSGRAGSLAIPLVKKLTETVGLFDADAAGYVHWGSTSQDVIDTAMVLLTRRALALIAEDLDRLIAALLQLAERYEATPVLGRTLMQPAQVVTFGYKCAHWVAPLVRARARIASASERALALQLGGAVGTLSAMGDAGPRVAARMAQQLGLRLPDEAWHTARDEWIALACEVGLLCGSVGKMARDLSLMSQGEIAELAEPVAKGRGGSSTMPHKRNPVSAMVALAAAARTPQRVAALLAAMTQEHERALGTWQAELAEWPGLFLSAHGAVRAMAEAMEGLQVDEARMLRNIDALQGLVFAEAVSMKLAALIGRDRSHALLEELTRRAVAERRHLRELVLEAIAGNPQLAVPAALIEELFDAHQAGEPAARIARDIVARLRGNGP